MELSKPEKQQYNRHLILDKIGQEGQLKLKAAKVLVIGAGGLGCPILQYLTAAGVGKIGIIDDDSVDQSNLQRQILYAQNDIGKPKVFAAIEKLSALNPYIEFIPYHFRLTPQNAIELFKEYDIIVDGSDNFPTRYLANDTAVISGKPIVFGSIYKFEGQVSVFNYQNGPTYRCLFPDPPKPDEVPNCSQIGVLGILPGIIGAMQGNEVLKIILELGEVLNGKLLTYNTLDNSQLIVNFEKNSEIKLTELLGDYNKFCGASNSQSELKFEEIKNKLEDYFLVDVREDWEHANFNIGGIQISVHELSIRLDELKNNQPILLYCELGSRSLMGQKFLSSLIPDKTVYTLKGGLKSIEKHT